MSHQTRSLAISLQIVALLCAPIPAASPQASATGAVAWTLLPPDVSSVQAGDRLDVSLRGIVDRGWYVYAMSQPRGGPTALRITLPEGQPFALSGAIKAPAPTRAWDPSFEIETAKHEGTVTFVLPVRVADTAPEGKRTLTVQLRYQACSDTLCLRPKTEMLSLVIDVRGRRTTTGVSNR